MPISRATYHLWMVSQSNAYATRQPLPIFIYMKQTVYVIQYEGPHSNRRGYESLDIWY